MQQSQRWLLTDHEWLRRRYLEDQVPVMTIAAQVGCSTSTVRRALTAADIVTRSPGQRRRLRAVDAAQILRLVAAHGRIGAAKELGIDRSTLYRDVRRLGIVEEERAAVRAHRRGKDSRD